MSPAAVRCIRCAAELAPDQEYCLECGAGQAPPPVAQWRRPLIAAALTVMLAGGVLAFGYTRMRDDARADAAGSNAGRGTAVKQAGATATAAASGSRKPAGAEHRAARPTR